VICFPCYAEGTPPFCHFGTRRTLTLRLVFALLPTNSFVSPSYAPCSRKSNDSRTYAKHRGGYLSGNVPKICRRADILVPGALFASPREYARVESVDEKQNHLTVERENGQRLSYDPRRLQGVTLYREAERAFSEGDRIQFTAPNREQHVANRELGTIEKLDDSGNLQIHLDSGRMIAFSVQENRHLGYGYAVTSHSSLGQTADRVLIHVDTDHGGEKLVNRRLAYVAVSRARYDAQIYTNDKAALTEGLGRDVSHQSALESISAPEPPVPQRSDPPSSLTLERQRTIERDLSPGR